MSTTALPDRRRPAASAATSRDLARRHPRLLVDRAGPARPGRAGRRWPRRGCSATSSRRSRTAPPSATSTGSSLLLAGFLVAADGADPLRPLRQPGARRAGAGRAARGLRRQHARAAGRHRRVGRLRRPAHPHQPRRRPARLVGALGAAGVDDRGGHRGAHLRRRAQRRLVGAAPVPARRAAAGRSGCGGTSPAPRTATCARARRTPQINATLTETVEGARTVEALGLGDERVAADRRRLADVVRRRALHAATCARCSSRAWRSPTCSRRWPRCCSAAGSTRRARSRSARSPRRRSTCRCSSTRSTGSSSILDELQIGAASLARLLGVAQVPDDRDGHRRASRSARSSTPSDVRFAYVEGRDVLHGVDLDVGVGERIAMVGPSGAGKSTLGRLLAGIHPPRTGAVTVGGVGLVELPLDDLRGHVALVTQEHHVFVGTLRENLALAAPPGRRRRRRSARALDAVDALEWVDALPDGPRHGGRLGRPRAHRRPGPADRAGPAGARRPAHAGARRGDLADRPARRPAPRALAGRRARGPHRDRDRPPALLRPRRRPGRGGRGRA